MVSLAVRAEARQGKARHGVSVIKSAFSRLRYPTAVRQGLRSPSRLYYPARWRNVFLEACVVRSAHAIVCSMVWSTIVTGVQYLVLAVE